MASPDSGVSPISHNHPVDEVGGDHSQPPRQDITPISPTDVWPTSHNHPVDDVGADHSQLPREQVTPISHDHPVDNIRKDYSQSLREQITPISYNHPVDDVREDHSQSPREQNPSISDDHPVDDVGGDHSQPLRQDVTPIPPTHQTEPFVSELDGTAVPPETRNTVDNDDATKNATTVDISHVANPEDLRRRLWTPFILTPLGLSLFLIAFFALLIATVALFLVSNNNGGIVSVNSNYYYLWTYSPTAGVFVFIQHSYYFAYSTISQCLF
jgi:hypothetical protein